MLHIISDCYRKYCAVRVIFFKKFTIIYFKPLHNITFLLCNIMQGEALWPDLINFVRILQIQKKSYHFQPSHSGISLFLFKNQESIDIFCIKKRRDEHPASYKKSTLKHQLQRYHHRVVSNCTEIKRIGFPQFQIGKNLMAQAKTAVFTAVCKD